MNSTEFFEVDEFPNLPEELRGLDLTPDELPKINLVSELNIELIQIDFRPHEAHILNELVGYRFMKEGKNTFHFKDLVSRACKEQESDWDNIEDDYILVNFDKSEQDAVIKMFNLPTIYPNAIYRLADLSRTLAFDFTE